MKSETKFRTSQVTPFFKTLTHTSYFPIQQKSIRGDADFILCARGFFVWLELKTDIGEPDKLQVYKASCVKHSGGIVLIGRPSNWEKIKNFLQLLDKGIYDKNYLRTIEQYEFSKSLPKANEQPHEISERIHDNAHREEIAGRESENENDLPKGNHGEIRPRRRRK